jgi:hypothetical protein
MMILRISKLAGCKVGGKLKIRGNEVLISCIIFGIPQKWGIAKHNHIMYLHKLLAPLIQQFCF